ncbi:hypothetical protein TWF128_003972 [Orbilia oligospora]|nr:hypothetical protein TWF128_003972 [Orbilia oligospora]
MARFKDNRLRLGLLGPTAALHSTGWPPTMRTPRFELQEESRPSNSECGSTHFGLQQSKAAARAGSTH